MPTKRTQLNLSLLPEHEEVFLALERLHRGEDHLRQRIGKALLDALVEHYRRYNNAHTPFLLLTAADARGLALAAEDRANYEAADPPDKTNRTRGGGPAHRVSKSA